MCAPINITTGGASGGCTGICWIIPQIIGLTALAGVLVWNFRDVLGKRLGFTRANDQS
jgi:hypothetical protein